MQKRLANNNSEKHNLTPPKAKKILALSKHEKTASVLGRRAMYYSKRFELNVAKRRLYLVVCVTHMAGSFNNNVWWWCGG